MDDSKTIISPNHRMCVPGLGVIIAPKAVGRLFQLHDYACCVDLRRRVYPRCVLYPILRPNLMHSPRYYHLLRAARLKRRYHREPERERSKFVNERMIFPNKET